MIGLGNVPSIAGWEGMLACHCPSGGPPRSGATPSSKRSITGCTDLDGARTAILVKVRQAVSGSRLGRALDLTEIQPSLRAVRGAALRFQLKESRYGAPTTCVAHFPHRRLRRGSRDRA